jgi:hypothetical protein
VACRHSSLRRRVLVDQAVEDRYSADLQGVEIGPGTAGNVRFVHPRQTPAAAPEPPAAGRLAPAAAAGLCRPGTSPVRPGTVRAGPGHARPGGLCWRSTGPRPADTAIPGGDASGHGELLRFGEQQRPSRSRTVTSGILQLARTITDRCSYGCQAFFGWGIRPGFMSAVAGQDREGPFLAEGRLL